MASVGASPSGRIGVVKGRTQRKDPTTGLYAKRDLTTGRFLPTDRRRRVGPGDAEQPSPVEPAVETPPVVGERTPG